MVGRLVYEMCYSDQPSDCRNAMHGGARGDMCQQSPLFHHCGQ